VITRPELLLADEPTGNVDPAIGNRLLRLFVELNRLGTSVILATHDYSLMEQLEAPRLMLDKGQLKVSAT
jgi:cell division transport system ATP-binding protein